LVINYCLLIIVPTAKTPQKPENLHPSETYCPICGVSTASKEGEIASNCYILSENQPEVRWGENGYARLLTEQSEAFIVLCICGLRLRTGTKNKSWVRLSLNYGQSSNDREPLRRLPKMLNLIDEENPSLSNH
jgi:galactose-1-phosphate uridylyltransferase